MRNTVNMFSQFTKVYQHVSSEDKLSAEHFSHFPFQIIAIFFTKKYKAAQLFKLIKISNVSWAANQHINLISEVSYDTEDWSNDAENSALHNRNKLHFKIC